ncbi:hypothetical protein BH11ACT7_BH11ACT7_17900 [soil metagenome]
MGPTEAWLAVGLAAAVMLALGIGVVAAQRRARIGALMSAHGWVRSRRDDTTTITAGDDSWAVEITRSFASQQSPPSTHIVTSTWTDAAPRRSSLALVAGPSPPPEMRDIAISAFAALPGRLKGWLGMTRPVAGAGLQIAEEVDPRLLAFVTEGQAHATGSLTAMADAVDTWCGNYGREREQPAVSLNAEGIQIRVRVDVSRSPAQLSAFVDLGRRCRAALSDIGT